MQNKLVRFQQKDTNIISPYFNTVTSKLFNSTTGGRVVLTDDATLCDTLQKVTDFYREDREVLVFTGNCKDTIYGCMELNWQARAWHDYCHIILQADFDYEGEMRVLQLQKLQIEQLLEGKAPINLIKHCLQLIDIEVKGQLEYLQEFGVFPKNQYEFTLNKLFN